MSLTRTHEVVDREFLLVAGSDVGVPNQVDLSIGGQVFNVAITKESHTVTIGGADVTSAAGDDIAVTGSIDGIAFFDIGVLYGLDDNDVVTITHPVKHLRFIAGGGILSTESWGLNIVLTR